MLPLSISALLPLALLPADAQAWGGPSRGLGSRVPLDQSPPIEPALHRRQAAGSSCGPNAGGAVCGTGLCCSSGGVCGVGRAYCDAPECLFEYGPACDANAVPSGANTSSVPRPALGSVLYGGGGVTQCSQAGTIAITYDDGPYVYTSSLLDVLQANDVPATFFVTSVNLAKGGLDNASTEWPAILRRMAAEGHQVASHTWSHQNLNDITSPQRRDQMVKNEMAIRNVLGYFPTYMRPPYNTCLSSSGCVADLEALGYHIIKYNIDTKDYANLTPDLIQNSKDIFSAAVNAGDPASSGFIVGNHDIHPQTVSNLTQFIIDEGKSLGYTFVTVGECLGDPAANWYRDPSTGGAVGGSASSRRDLVARAEEAAASSASGGAAVSTAGAAGSGGGAIWGVGFINVAFLLLLG